MPEHDTVPSALPDPGFDFQLTDFEDARRALEELPPGVRPLPNGGRIDWASRRRELSESERRLSPNAFNWLAALPSESRPLQLARAYPRVLNRIVETWRDPSVCHGVFDDLLLDRRGGRKGFPPVIAAEIVALRDHYTANARSGRV